MNIIRKYKLSLLDIETLTEKELLDLNLIFSYIKYSKENEEVINFVYSNLFNLKIVKLENFPDFLYFFKEDQCIFSYNLIDNFFGIKNDFHEKFFTQFNYTDLQIQELIKSIIEQKYKLINIIPYKNSFYIYFNNVEKIYKYEYNKTI